MKLPCIVLEFNNYCYVFIFTSLDYYSFDSLGKELSIGKLTLANIETYILSFG